MVHVACGAITAAFGVFALFAVSQKSVVLIILAVLLVAAAIITWVMAARSGTQPAQETTEVPTLDNILPKAFRTQILQAKNQRERLQEKQALADEVFRKAFADSTISRDRYMSGVKAAARAIAANEEQIANRIYLFDQEGWRQAKAENQPYPAYEQTLAFLEEKMVDSEQLLNKIDEVTVEASQIGQASDKKAALEHLDELIETTAFYKEKEH